jgi:hypothetical protein
VGCRVLAFLGMALSTVGFLSSAYVSNFYAFFFTFSLLPGHPTLRCCYACIDAHGVFQVLDLVLLESPIRLSCTNTMTNDERWRRE